MREGGCEIFVALPFLAPCSFVGGNQLHPHVTNALNGVVRVGDNGDTSRKRVGQVQRCEVGNDITMVYAIPHSVPRIVGQYNGY